MSPDAVSAVQHVFKYVCS